MEMKLRCDLAFPSINKAMRSIPLLVERPASARQTLPKLFPARFRMRPR